MCAVTRRVKIVCTIGPATANLEKIRELVRAGMDVARLNFSHGTHAEHAQVYSMVRAASDESGRAGAWRTGDEVRVTVEDVPGTHDRVSTTYAGLARDAREGHLLLVDDGKVALAVRKVEDLRVDLVALSFVRSPADIDMVHQTMDEVSGSRLPVIAKLEKPEAVDNLEAIVLAFDGVMVARGDLGVELPLENVPLVQKRAIQVARENAKPIIVVTQMLDSKPPTRWSGLWTTRCSRSDVSSQETWW